MADPQFGLACGKRDGFLWYEIGGLVLKSDTWERREKDSVLGLGPLGGQHLLMNHILAHPELVRGRRVFEPFAGAGPFGFPAVRAGAERTDLLDVNPRAIAFLKETAERNALPASRFRILEGRIEDFRPDEPYDVLFANPPFIPVPETVRAPVHSDGGFDGGRVTRMFLEGMEGLLKPEGEAFLLLLQIESGGRPIVVPDLERHLTDRPVELTRCRPKPFDMTRMFPVWKEMLPDEAEAIDRWEEKLTAAYGTNLGRNVYIVHIGRQGARPTECVIRDYDGRKYGPGFYPPRNVSVEDAVRGLIRWELRLTKE